ncbi:UNVERIFIED_CONTAM: hypothetical protein FKN15_005068 [Acipenser sinensis]
MGEPTEVEPVSSPTAIISTPSSSPAQSQLSELDINVNPHLVSSDLLTVDLTELEISDFLGAAGNQIDYVFPIDEVVFLPDDTVDDDEVVIGAVSNENLQMDDTVPWQEESTRWFSNQQDGSEPTPVTTTVMGRRGHCLIDLITAFKNPDILETDVHIKMRLPNGDLEEGEGVGEFRDCLTEFWTDFYSRCTLGADGAKVPFIRHDYQAEEWQTITRILVKGWKTTGHFPVQLAAPFLEEVLYGASTSSLTESFLQYVSDQEREIFLKALNDFDSVDTDAALDALDAHDCHSSPTKDNLLPLLSQLGHKALVQAPMYVTECWRL